MVKQCKLFRDSQSKNLNFYEFSRVSPGAHPLTKKPEDSGHEIAGIMESKVKLPRGVGCRKLGNLCWDSALDLWTLDHFELGFFELDCGALSFSQE